ncbi:MAG: hypothetical protein R3E12_06685 [Candidatus Eisenbacteria bacterium]
MGRGAVWTCDLDDDVDCVDWDYFQAVWTGAGEPTPPPDATTDAPEAPGPTETPLHTRVQPNPMTDAATIVYSLATTVDGHAHDLRRERPQRTHLVGAESERGTTTT